MQDLRLWERIRKDLQNFEIAFTRILETLGEDSQGFAKIKTLGEDLQDFGI